MICRLTPMLNGAAAYCQGRCIHGPFARTRVTPEVISYPEGWLRILSPIALTAGTTKIATVTRRPGPEKTPRSIEQRAATLQRTLYLRGGRWNAC
jgi:hypothetical protein